MKRRERRAKSDSELPSDVCASCAFNKHPAKHGMENLLNVKLLLSKTKKKQNEKENHKHTASNTASERNDEIAIGI